MSVTRKPPKPMESKPFWIANALIAPVFIWLLGKLQHWW